MWSTRRNALKLGLGCIGAAALGSPGRTTRSAQTHTQTQEIVIATRDGPPIAGAAIRHGQSFTLRTGIPVRVVQTSFDRLYDEVMVGFITDQNRYDVLIFPSAWLGDLAPYLAAVPEPLVQSDAFRDIHPAYRDGLMRWRDTWMAMTIDGDLHIGAYRRDLFDDERHRRAFMDLFGYPLSPPRTWRQYHEIAAYFHDQPQERGRPLAGTLETFAPEGQRIWTLFSRAAAYASDPEEPGTMFFDPDNMAPSIANPGWVRALQEYLAIRAFVPVNTGNLSSYGIRTRFAAGEAAMIIDWTDTGVLSNDPVRSKVSGRIGYFMLPGSDEVWSTRRKRWLKLDGARQVPFLAFGGWIAAVSAHSLRSDAAWQYVAWLGSPENSAIDVVDGTSGINPYRQSHLDDGELWERALGAESGGHAQSYVGVIRNSLDSPNVAHDLRIPGFRAYAAALDTQIGRALNRQTNAETALAQAAEIWQRITDRLGRQGQRRHYRRAMGLAL